MRDEPERTAAGFASLQLALWISMTREPLRDEDQDASLLTLVAEAERVSGRVGVDRAAAALWRQPTGSQLNSSPLLRATIVEAEIEVHLCRVVPPTTIATT